MKNDPIQALMNRTSEVREKTWCDSTK